MSLLSTSARTMLRANAERSRCQDTGGGACEGQDTGRQRSCNPLPLVKLFNPIGTATWIVTELYDDGDTLFGLGDLGLGFPELGCFSLRAIEGIHLPLGLGIERDRAFFTRHRLSVWTATARRTRSIRDAEILLARSAFAGRWEAPLPPLGTGPGG